MTARVSRAQTVDSEEMLRKHGATKERSRKPPLKILTSLKPPGGAQLGVPRQTLARRDAVNSLCLVPGAWLEQPF